MQDYAKSNRLSLNTILFFALILFIAFLPVSSFLFFIKNDAFTGYFPPKFFMSESIHAGHLPLWNPYINYGFPQYGDMSGGYWNPITWLIASTAGYNAYTFTIETLLYILLGGIGMYKLCSYWKLLPVTAFIASVSFMCCGYNVGHLQHFNWLSGAAFLPWCLWSYLRMIQSFSVKKIFIAVLMFYMLVSAAHPGISIAAFYFFLLLAIFLIIKKDLAVTGNQGGKKIGITHVIFLAALLFVSAGLITGYADLLPHFTRGEKIDLQSSLLNDTTFTSWISVLFPLSTVKNDAFFATDISMRNCYTGLVIFSFLLLAVFRKKNRWQLFFLFTGLAFALLSAGGFIKIFAYKFIPLIGYVRLNGEFSIFSLLCFILVAAMELDKFITAKENYKKHLKWILLTLQACAGIAFIVGFIYVFFGRNSFLFSNIIGNNITSKLKSVLDNSSFYDMLLIQVFIQLLILQAIKISLKTQRWQLLKLLVVADLIIASLLNIPFTGAGKASVADLQRVLNKSPEGINAPLFFMAGATPSVPLHEQQMIGDWSMYNKQIGTAKEVAYPIILKNMRAYFENIEKGDSSYLKQPYLFFSKENKDNHFALVKFTGSSVIVTLTAADTGKLVLQQNWYPHWKDNKGNTVEKYGTNFMSVPVKKGAQTVTYTFDPKKVKYAMFVSLATFLLMIFYLLFIKIRSLSLSSRQI